MSASENESMGIEQDIVESFNKEWTKVSHEGKNLVVGKQRTAVGTMKYVFFTHKDFIERNRAEDKVMTIVNGKPADVNPATIWLNSITARHAENGFMFDPTAEAGAVINGAFNLWVGWGTDIEKVMKEETLESLHKDKAIQKYFKHIKDVVCYGEPKAFLYLMNWMSHLVQCPNKKPGVSPILKGGKGVGKGLVMTPLGRIAGSHYLHATRGSQVTGKFNAALENKILAFADEFGSGDDTRTRTMVSNALKGMITEKTNNIERKGKDLITVPCYMRVVISSNFDSPVDISRDERRYLVLDIPSDRKQSREYYDELSSMIDTQEFANKLHAFLLKRDITGFNPFDVPNTQELDNQKLNSMTPAERYVYSNLQSGHWRRNWKPSGDYTEWPTAIMVSRECETDGSFTGYLDRNRLRESDPAKALGKVMKMIGGVRKRITFAGGRAWVYELPDIDECRDRWDYAFGGETDWD